MRVLREGRGGFKIPFALPSLPSSGQLITWQRSCHNYDVTHRSPDPRVSLDSWQPVHCNPCSTSSSWLGPSSSARIHSWKGWQFPPLIAAAAARLVKSNMHFDVHTYIFMCIIAAMGGIIDLMGYKSVTESPGLTYIKYISHKNTDRRDPGCPNIVIIRTWHKKSRHNKSTRSHQGGCVKHGRNLRRSCLLPHCDILSLSIKIIYKW